MMRQITICGSNVRRATSCATMAALMGAAFLVTAVSGTAQPTNSQQANSQIGVFPLSTSSPEARRLVEESFDQGFDRLRQPEQIELLRKAVQIDPEFAIAHEFLVEASFDSAEKVREQEKAFATRSHASPSEQLAIEWFQDAADQKLMSAIFKMNTLLHQYPRDKWIVWMAVMWLTHQGQYARAIDIYERSGLTDAPGFLNHMAYLYSHFRQFDKAFALMDLYAAMMPNEANPQDSYGEISCRGGRFEQAIEHYRTAMAINPQFYNSQFGIADTYSVMGDQVRARQEYEIGFQKFSPPEVQQIRWRTKEATTFIREGDYVSADHAFQAVADYARSRQNSRAEADTYRQMALYQQNPKHGLVFLDKAEAATQEAKNTEKISTEQELAQILRARVEIALKMGMTKLAASNLARLTEMSEISQDRQIEVEYHGAAGAVLFSEHKYDEAVSHLEEDPNNLFSLRLLVDAYQKIGYSAGAMQTSKILAGRNDPTLEQALVVPAFRKCCDTLTCSGGAKAACLRR